MGEGGSTAKRGADVIGAAATLDAGGGVVVVDEVAAEVKEDAEVGISVVDGTTVVDSIVAGRLDGGAVIALAGVVGSGIVEDDDVATALAAEDDEVAAEVEEWKILA
mmetsp:Transcript_28200/g.56937  ORF Transcript_28200/g.56937 Transcript_28200/m.56937 type:complete len:107 (+) Transcript_28200:4111-4431(+)